ncbi:MAG TPA: hypothetical protein VGA17_02785, partial [Nitrospiraceae bacterium]
ENPDQAAAPSVYRRRPLPPSSPFLYSNNSPLLRHGILALDHWITAIKADTRHIPQIELTP